MKRGDYVTGTDRSYKRSIYKIGEIYPPILGPNNNKAVSVSFVSYDGIIGDGPDWSIRNTDEFRLATLKEIEESAFPEGFDFFIAYLDAGLVYNSQPTNNMICEIQRLRKLMSIKGIQFDVSKLGDSSEGHSAEAPMDYEKGYAEWEPKPGIMEVKKHKCHCDLTGPNCWLGCRCGGI